MFTPIICRQDKCGLPNYDKTSHCFSDSTHHTCCMLDPEARKYADNSGNPIGIASEDSFYLRYGKKPDKLAPWYSEMNLINL